MDRIVEWRLIHRTPDEPRGIFARSKFGVTPVDIWYEDQGINIFAFCTKRDVSARPSRQSGVFAIIEG
jgi:extracellular factor (EF) 3-hydroxypalmitic acid methyl ester biosynthesis protein